MIYTRSSFISHSKSASVGLKKRKQNLGRSISFENKRKLQLLGSKRERSRIEEEKKHHL